MFAIPCDVRRAVFSRTSACGGQNKVDNLHTPTLVKLRRTQKDLTIAHLLIPSAT